MKFALRMMVLSVCVSVAGSAYGQQMMPAPRLRGVVSNVAGNGRCFTLTNRFGAQTTVLLAPSTKYLLNKEETGIQDVLVPGDRVTVEIGLDGNAMTVSNNHAGRMTSAELKGLLGITDAECAVIAPRLARVQELEEASVGRGTSGSPVRSAFDAVRFAVRDPSTPAWKIQSLLKTLREAKAEAARDLQKAREDLVSLLTVRQEAVLVEQGIL